MKYNLIETDVVELYERLVVVISNISLESIATLLIAHKDECTNGMNSRLCLEVQHLFETFHAFRELVENMFAQNKNTDTFSFQTGDFNELTIALQILSIEENKMKVFYLMFDVIVITR